MDIISPKPTHNVEVKNIFKLTSGTDRAQMGGNMVGLFIGLLIAAIVVLQVFIPVVQDAIDSSGITGTEQTVVELLPLFAVLLLLIALAGPLMRRV